MYEQFDVKERIVFVRVQYTFVAVLRAYKGRATEDPFDIATKGMEEDGINYEGNGVQAIFIDHSDVSLN